MACSICGQPGHNSATCRKHGVIIRVDNLTKNEVKQFSDKVVEDKNDICPNGRGTIVSGRQDQLGHEEKKQIGKDG